MKTEDTDQPRSLTDPWILENEHVFDPETLLSAIMLKGAQMEPLYTDPIFFYRMNRMWWKKWLPTFEAWFTVLEKEYEPLWNKNAWEETHEDTYDVGTNDTATANTEVVDDDTTGRKVINRTENDDEDISATKNAQSTSNTENTVSAYDSSTYQPHDNSKTVASSQETTTAHDEKDITEAITENDTGTDDRTTTFNGKIDNDTTNDRDFDRTTHTWGNIGVTTSQQMLESELKVRYFNLYEHMSDIFLGEMAVRVF